MAGEDAEFHRDLRHLERKLGWGAPRLTLGLVPTQRAGEGLGQYCDDCDWHLQRCPYFPLWVAKEPRCWVYTSRGLRQVT